MYVLVSFLNYIFISERWEAKKPYFIQTLFITLDYNFQLLRGGQGNHTLCKQVDTSNLSGKYQPGKLSLVTKCRKLYF